MSILYSLLKDNGVMILSDFHPLRKCIDKANSIQTQGNYFDDELYNGDVAYKHNEKACKHNQYMLTCIIIIISILIPYKPYSVCNKMEVLWWSALIIMEW